MGATPVAISLAYIIEEGLPLEELRLVTASAAAAAAKAGARIVTGDTKVVGRGAADRLFVNTSGIGLVPDGVAPSADRAAPGDVADPVGADRAPRRGHHERPRGPGVRGGDHVGHAGAQRPRGRDARGGAGHPRPARPHPRRPVLGAQRDRGGVPRGHGPGRAGAADPRARCAPPASSWAWTRSTSRTRASCVAIVPAGVRGRRAGRDARGPGGRGGRGHRRASSRITRAWSRSRRSWAPSGSWTCWWGSSCPGSAEGARGRTLPQARSGPPGGPERVYGSVPGDSHRWRPGAVRSRVAQRTAPGPRRCICSITGR